MPRNGYAEAPAIEPTRLTASTGRRARSTSPPQMRRKSRAKSVMSRVGVREISQNDPSTAGPINTANANVPMPTTAAQCKPREQHGAFEHRAHDTDAHVRPVRADEHQRVARPRAERRADVEAPSRRRRGRGPATSSAGACGERPASRGAGRSRAAARARRTARSAAAFATVPKPGLEPSAQASRSTSDRDQLVGDPERERRVLRDALVQHVPRRQAEARLEERDDAAGAEEEAGDEPDRTRGAPATQDGSRVHRRTLVDGRDQDERGEEPERGCEVAHLLMLGPRRAAFVSPRFGIR